MRIDAGNPLELKQGFPNKVQVPGLESTDPQIVKRQVTCFRLQKKKTRTNFTEDQNLFIKTVSKDLFLSHSHFTDTIVILLAKLYLGLLLNLPAA